MPIPHSSFRGSGTSIHDTQQKMSNDFGASEKMRVEALQRERQRITKERAKNTLAEKKRKFDLNKNEINQKEIDIRRLNSELARAEADVREIDRYSGEQNDKVIHQRTIVHDMSVKIEKLQVELAQLKNQSEKIGLALQHLESEKNYKDKTKEAKKNSFHQVQIAKTRQENEVARLRGENNRLDHEIQLLEREAR